MDLTLPSPAKYGATCVKPAPWVEQDPCEGYCRLRYVSAKDMRVSGSERRRVAMVSGLEGMGFKGMGTPACSDGELW